MAEKLRSSDSCDSPHRCGFDGDQAVEMKRILDAFIRVHEAARDTASEETVALLGLCQSVIVPVLEGLVLARERGLPRNLAWAIAELRPAMEEVAFFVENLVVERPAYVQHILHILGGVAKKPPSAQL